MKVLITGATGFVGNEVVRQLVAGGYAVRVLARDPASRAVGSLTARFPVEVVRGEIGGERPLSEALTGVEAVIHLVGIIAEVGSATFERVHARGTAELVQVAEQAGVRRFIHMSALGVRPDAASRYHQTKWAAEEAVRHSKLAWTIFRPSVIYGPGDQFVNLFVRMSRWSPLLPVLGDDRHRLQPVGVGAVGRCFVGALTEPRSIGRVFDVCGPERLTLRQILGHVLAVTGRRRWLVRVPPRLAEAQAMVLELLFARLLGQAPPLNRDQLIMLGEDNIGDPTAASALFRLSEETFRDGIARYLAGR